MCDEPGHLCINHPLARIQKYYDGIDSIREKFTVPVAWLALSGLLKFDICGGRDEAITAEKNKLKKDLFG